MNSLSKVHAYGMAASTFDREDTAVAANDSMEDFSNISVATLKKGMIVFVKKRPCTGHHHVMKPPSSAVC